MVEKRIWRPKGWVTPKAEFHPLHCLAADACVGKSYEDGADAMLESLKLQEGSLFLVGAQNATDDTKLKICIENRQGWLIFIPINKQASEMIVKLGSYTNGGYIDQIKIVGQAYETGADDMYQACRKKLGKMAFLLDEED